MVLNINPTTVRSQFSGFREKHKEYRKRGHAGTLHPSKCKVEPHKPEIKSSIPQNHTKKAIAVLQVYRFPIFLYQNQEVS